MLVIEARDQLGRQDLGVIAFAAIARRARRAPPRAADFTAEVEREWNSR